MIYTVEGYKVCMGVYVIDMKVWELRDQDKTAKELVLGLQWIVALGIK